MHKFKVGQKVKHDRHGVIVLLKDIGGSGNWYAEGFRPGRDLIVSEDNIKPITRRVKR
jgi:hypothetical protein